MNVCICIYVFAYVNVFVFLNLLIKSIASPSITPSKLNNSALTDKFGRYHTYLRISLTERCNLRCKYVYMYVLAYIFMYVRTYLYVITMYECSNIHTYIYISLIY